MLACTFRVATWSYDRCPVAPCVGKFLVCSTFHLLFPNCFCLSIYRLVLPSFAILHISTSPLAFVVLVCLISSLSFHEGSFLCCKTRQIGQYIRPSICSSSLSLQFCFSIQVHILIQFYQVLLAKLIPSLFSPYI